MIIPTIILRTSTFDYFRKETKSLNGPEFSNEKIRQPIKDLPDPQIRKLKKIFKNKETKS
jgi:hypothetical protein